MNAALLPSAPAATGLGPALLAHLDEQLASTGRLLQIVLAQAAAIRDRDVDTVLSAITEIQGEMDRRAGLERVRAQILAHAGAQLGLDLGDRGEDGVDVAVADRGGLGEDDLQQAPGGGELLVEVGEQRGAEPGGRGGAGEQSGVHDVPSCDMALSIWTASPRPPSAMTASAIAPGSMSR